VVAGDADYELRVDTGIRAFWESQRFQVSAQGSPLTYSVVGQRFIEKGSTYLVVGQYDKVGAVHYVRVTCVRTTGDASGPVSVGQANSADTGQLVGRDVDVLVRDMRVRLSVALNSLRAADAQSFGGDPPDAGPDGYERPEPVPSRFESWIPPTTALLVGVDDYDHLEALSNPVRDINAIAAQLAESYDVQIEKLVNPTRREFLTRLNELAGRRYADGSQLLVFFAGHGWYDEVTKRGFLALKDSEAPQDDVLKDTLVHHSEVRTILERLDCPHVLLVLDACHGGTLDPNIALGRSIGKADAVRLEDREDLARAKLRPRTRLYMTSGGNEYVPDGRPGSHSPFAAQYLNALRSLGGKDGILTAEEVYHGYLDQGLNPRPRSGELWGNEPNSTFLLIARHMPVEPPPPPKMAQLTVHVFPDAAVTLAKHSDESRIRPPERTRPHQGVVSGTHTFSIPPGRYVVRVMSETGEVASVVTTVAEGAHELEIWLPQTTAPSPE
jgi:hypothetical protein